MINSNDVHDADTIELNAVDARLAALTDLDRSLTPSRRRIANEILFHLNTAGSKSLRHHTLLVGPFGSGKSHVMKYLQTVLRQFQESTAVMVIQEETRSILSLFDFIVTCLRYYDAISSDQLVATLQSTDPDPLTAVIALFDEHTDGRKTAIFVEDFSELFRNMTSDDRDAMQAFFSERPHITVVASSMSMIMEKRTALGTLANLFSVKRLPELSADETSMFLGRMLMNQKHLPPLETSAMMVLHHIAGGNPHLMEESGRFLNAREWPDVRQVVPELIEQIFEPHFERRMRSLDETQRMVLKAIATHDGEALSEERLGELVDIPKDDLASALQDLKLGLYIEQVRVGQVSYLDIHEPFLRILLDRDGESLEDFRTLVLLTANWIEVERRRKFEFLPGATREDDEPGPNPDDSLDAHMALLETDRQHPGAAVAVFNTLVAHSRFDALAFLENVLATEGRSLNDALKIVLDIRDGADSDADLVGQVTAVAAKSPDAITQSVIHSFIENRDEDTPFLQETLLPLIDDLGAESPVMRLLQTLIQRYLDRDDIAGHSLLHIPVELRTLLTKHTKTKNQLYAR